MYRRAVLGSACAGTVLSLAGCLEEFDSEASPDPPKRGGAALPLFEYVPATSNLAVEIAGTVYEDAATSELMAYFVHSLRDFVDYSSLALLQEETLRSETDLDPTAISAQLVYGTVSGPLLGSYVQEMGVLIDTEWSGEELVTGLEAIHQTTYQEATASGPEEGTVYQSDERNVPIVGQLSDDSYVVGDPHAVSQSLDLASGNDAEPVTGDMLVGRDGTPPAPIRTTWVPDGRAMPFPIGDLPVDDQLEVLDDSWAVTQTLDPGTDEDALEFRWFMAGADDAAEWADTIEALLDILSGTIEDEEVAAVAEDVRVEQEGPVVAVIVEAETATIERALKDFFPNVTEPVRE